MAGQQTIQRQHAWGWPHTGLRWKERNGSYNLKWLGFRAFWGPMMGRTWVTISWDCVTVQESVVKMNQKYVFRSNHLILISWLHPAPIGHDMSPPVDHLYLYPRVFLTFRPLTWIWTGLSARWSEPTDENPQVTVHLDVSILRRSELLPI